MRNTTEISEAAASSWQIACSSCDAFMTITPDDAGKPTRCPACDEYLIAPKSRVAPGLVLGDFILRDQLGVGGRGQVFAAYQRSLDRRCAIKVLHPHYVDRGGSHDELVAEARLAARLNHPHIVQCYAVGEEQGLVYFAMEFVAGKSLQALMQTRLKLAPFRALEILRQVVMALDYAWREQRIVHRDIKPDNVMITDDGISKLADFGLARSAHELDVETPADLFSGTPLYMSPEQIEGSPMDLRSDMYALGIVLYQCITGQLPFDGASPEEILQQHLSDYPPYPNVHIPALPLPLCHMVMTMLAKEAADRFPDYETLLEKIDQCRVLCPDPGSSVNLTRTDLLAAMPMPLAPTQTPVSPRRSPRQLKVIAPSDSQVRPAVAAPAHSTDSGQSPAPSPVRPTPLPTANVDSRTPNAAATGESAGGDDHSVNSRGLIIAVAAGLLLVITGIVAVIALGEHQEPPPQQPLPRLTAPQPPPQTPPPVVASQPVAAAEPAPAALAPVPRLEIHAIMPDPVGWDPGHEWIELTNSGDGVVDLTGWRLRSNDGSDLPLSGQIRAGQTLRLTLPDDALTLKNTGDRLQLLDPAGQTASRFDYDMDRVTEGRVLTRE